MSFEQFTNLMPVTKSIKMKLIPVGKTNDNLIKDKVVENAKEAEENINEVKNYIDEFHKDYITGMLGRDILDSEELRTLYETEDPEIRKTILDELANKVADYFAADETYKNMADKNILKVLMSFFSGNSKAINTINMFDKDVTTLRDYLALRKRMYEYDPQKKGISIPRRTIIENLPIYLDNYKIWERILGYLPAEDLAKIRNEIADISLEPENYNKYLSQSGIDTYNAIIGGITKEDGSVVKGLNVLINLYNQHSTEDKLPVLRPLYKQVMTERKSLSFISEGIKDDKQLYEMVNDHVDAVQDILPDIESLIAGLQDEYDLSKVFVRKDQYGNISNYIFSKYNIIYDAIIEEYNEAHPAKNRETKAYIDKRKKALDGIPCYSIKRLSELVDKKIEKYFSSKLSDCMYELDICIRGYKGNKNRDNFSLNKAAKASVKSVLDSVVAICRLLKELLPAELPNDNDIVFYSELHRILDVIDNHSLYNKVRNYATKKDFSVKELPLNFNHKTNFLSGWMNEDVSAGIILLRNNNYYLGVISPSDKKCIKVCPEAVTKDRYSLVDYNLIADPIKSLPGKYMRNKFMSANESFCDKWSSIINKYRLRKDGTYAYTLEDERELIKYYKACLELDGVCSAFDMTFKDSYDSEKPLYEFFNDLATKCYKLNFKEVDVSYIDSLVDKGSLYLFQIYNKDMSEYSQGKPNPFTLYWKALFDEESINKRIYKLNGGAKISFRAKTLTDPVVHKAGEGIKSKRLPNKDNKFTYDIIKDKRYTLDQFFLSVSLEINYNADKYVRFNTLVNQYIRDNKDTMHVIGITRGSRNLIYYTVSDMNGNIVEHGSFNTVKDCFKTKEGTFPIETDYRKMLDEREKENDAKQLSWDSEYSIKDMKSGYISMVVPKIAKLMLKYNAVLVLEDLTGGIKDRMKAIEKTVFTDLENALMSKLNLLITDKDMSHRGAGSTLYPYQLVPAVDTKSSLKYQQGFVFYLNPSYTSSLDPDTGFVNMLDTRYKGKEAAKKFVKNFGFIRRDTDCYRFGVDFTKFRYISMSGIKTDWVLNSLGRRTYMRRDKDANNKWTCDVIDMTEYFDNLFAEFGIDTSDKIAEQIVNIDKSELYDRFMTAVKLMLQSINSNYDDSWYVSPVEGSIYNTREINADCIGALNMARKGIIAINKILNSDEDYVKISSGSDEWLTEAQKCKPQS